MSTARAAIDERLRQRAEPDGFLPFDHFMEVALYAPDLGFYARPRSPLGPGGDFYTAAHVHPLYGRTVASRVRAVLDTLPADRPARVVEVGPGDGTLAAEIVRGLIAAPPARTDWRYTLVERSHPRAREALGRAQAAAGARAASVESAESLGASGPLSGVVLAHELLDAQPAQRFRWTGTRWNELGVRWTSGAWRGAERPSARAPTSAIAAEELTVGTVLEIQPAAASVLREVGDHLARGVAIVIDYGMEETELLRGHSGGTLAAVAEHRTFPDPLERPGDLDLSVFVNFSRARSAALASGLALVAEDSLGQSLVRWGFGVEYAAAETACRTDKERVGLQLAAKKLLYGFDRFRAIELAPVGPTGPT